MLGAVVGDVIGSPFEQYNVKSTRFRPFDRGARCTDDSVLTVATADALLGDGDYRRAYQEYFHRFPDAGYALPHEFGLFDEAGNIAVRCALQQFLSHPDVKAMIAGPLLPAICVAAVLFLRRWQPQGRGFPLDG